MDTVSPTTTGEDSKGVPAEVDRRAQAVQLFGEVSAMLSEAAKSLNIRSGDPALESKGGFPSIAFSTTCHDR